MVYVLLPLATAAIGLVLWEELVTRFRVHVTVMPPPSRILRVIVEDLPLLSRNALPTGLEALISFLIATSLGIAVALAITYSPLIREAVYPNLVMFQLIPKIALAPLFIVWLGIGSRNRLAFAVFNSVFPIVIATATGLTAVNRDLVRLVRSLTASEWQVFVWVRLPSALPHLFSGMKIAITLALIGIIAGEFISSERGLGHEIMMYASRMETAGIMAAIVVMCSVGLVLYGAVSLAEHLTKRRYGARE